MFSGGEKGFPSVERADDEHMAVVLHLRKAHVTTVVNKAAVGGAFLLSRLCRARAGARCMPKPSTAHGAVYRNGLSNAMPAGAEPTALPTHHAHDLVRGGAVVCTCGRGSPGPARLLKNRGGRRVEQRAPHIRNGLQAKKSARKQEHLAVISR